MKHRMAFRSLPPTFYSLPWTSFQLMTAHQLCPITSNYSCWQANSNLLKPIQDFIPPWVAKDVPLLKTSYQLDIIIWSGGLAAVYLVHPQLFLLERLQMPQPYISSNVYKFSGRQETIAQTDFLARDMVSREGEQHPMIYVFATASMT